MSTIISNKQNNDALNDYNNFLIDLLNQGEHMSVPDFAQKLLVCGILLTDSDSVNTALDIGADTSIKYSKNTILTFKNFGYDLTKSES